MPRASRTTPPFELHVERLEPRGVGAGDHEGRAVHVRGAPPGAVVLARPFARKKGVIHARRQALVQPPPGAVEPRCAAFGTCGGCALQELPLAAQRAAKHDLVLRSVGLLQGVPVVGPLGLPVEYAYRNRVELTFGDRRFLSDEDHRAGVDNQGRFLGFHAPERFDRVVDVARCELVSEGMNALIDAARAHLATSALPPWDTRGQRGFWRHLLLREGQDGDRLVLVFTAPPEDEALARAELDALAASLPEVGGVLWMVNDRVADAAIGEQRAVLRGRPWLEERLGHLRFRLAPLDFFQTNTPGAEVLYSVVAEAAGRGRRLLDLYCGTGAIGLWLAPAFAEVVGVEIHAPAVESAARNAEVNGIAHARFLAGEVERVALELDGDVVVVDPPRAGLHPRAARWLAALPAERLVYVACHAPSLGRDRAILEEGGWRLDALWTVDLFPQTGHVEAVARFVR
ncbi:MAG: 23S rRNA (uracil(1939)-C(5))-methyltransferase RlmD [Pseudomonadota bacterium]